MSDKTTQDYLAYLAALTPEQALHNLLSDMHEARTPTHNIDLGIGLSAAIEEANEVLARFGMSRVQITNREHA